jgi:hypothetical protein
MNSLAVEDGDNDRQAVKEALGTPGGSRAKPYRRVAHLEEGDWTSRSIHIVGELQGSVGSDADVMRMMFDANHFPGPLHRREVRGHRLEARVLIPPQLEFPEDIAVGELRNQFSREFLALLLRRLSISSPLFFPGLWKKAPQQPGQTSYACEEGINT